MKTYLKETGVKTLGWLAKASVLLLLPVGAGIRAAPAQPKSNTVTTNYYVFGGTNAIQMRAAMIEARPWKQTMNFDAHTKWDVNSTYRYARTNGEFKLTDVDVKCKVAITLPMWIPGKPVTRELVSRWQRCLAGLSVHEQGHLQLAQGAAAEVRRQLGELAGFASAQDLRKAADHALNGTIEEFRQRERKYDEVTGHGRTQGAIFPVEVEPDEAVNSSTGPGGGFPRRQNTRGR